MTFVPVVKSFAWPVVTWGPLSANQPYSIMTDNAGAFRFETRGYERYSSPAYSDTPNMIRSEVYGPAFPPRTPVNFNYTFMVDTGPVTTNCWFIVGQIHAQPNAGQASPCVALNIQPDQGGATGEKIVINRNYRAPGGTQQFTSLGSMPFTRGVKHKVAIGFVDGRGTGAGYISVIYDGVQVARLSGITGFDGGGATDWCDVKFGIYAGGKGPSATAIPDPDQNLVVTYFNPTFTVGP